LWTFGFLHELSSPFHLLFNLLALYFFGTMLEARVGPRRFLMQYLAALALGGLVHLTLSPWLGFSAVVGASGAVLYCVIACATLDPRAQVLFFFVPMTLRTMAMILVGVDLFTMLSPGASRTASDVHLAGAALGFVAARRGWIYFDPGQWWGERREQREADSEASDEQRLDQLLSRIKSEGIHALSKRDKDFLARMSKR
jgi:membrane associated rhomboid family serine protease